MEEHKQCTYNVTLRLVCTTIVVVEDNEYYERTYSESVSVALGIQHAKRMRRVILSSVACPTVHYFPSLSHI